MRNRKDWTAQVPPIVGNRAIIEKVEGSNAFESVRPGGDQLQTNGDQLQTNGDQLQTNGDQLQTNGDQLQTNGRHFRPKKQPRKPRKKRVTFTPNLVTSNILREIRAKYGSSYSVFINASIEYYNKSTDCS
jgi:hypothetical protein